MLDGVLELDIRAWPLVRHHASIAIDDLLWESVFHFRLNYGWSSEISVEVSVLLIQAARLL